MKSVLNSVPLLQLRFILLIIIAVGIIISDRYFNTFDQIRTYMDTAVSPFYFVSSSPYKFFDIISQNLSSRNQLKFENRVLRKELLLKNSELLMLNQYKKENIHLRKLLNLPFRKNEQRIVTQVISTINNPYNDQIVIDKGSIDNVYEGQPVINDKGVVGQVIAVAKLTSRVLLICDATHAIPSQVSRNNTRTIVRGSGCANDLQLEYLPINTDIRIGDVLVTSGLDGRFPEGYPVAVVSSIKFDNQHNYAAIRAYPIVNLKHLRYLLLLWKSNNHNDQ